MPKPDINASVAHTYRPAGALLSTRNMKTFKGEARGYLSAILYMAPHTIAGGKTLCPHSTPACRAGCLYSAGRGAFERTKRARVRRAQEWLSNPTQFLDRLAMEIDGLADLAASNDLKLVVRLNGTSDVIWEREAWRNATSLMAAFPSIQFTDYTKIPLEHRAPPPNYHLVFSIADDNAALALRYMREGHSVSVVVPKETKAELLIASAGAPDIFRGHLGLHHVIDGDTDDLRFLDKPRSLILLSPKGRAVLDTALVRENPLEDLMVAM